MVGWWTGWLLAAFVTGATVANADEFLGVEKDGDAPSAPPAARGDAGETAAPAATKKARRRAEPKDREDDAGGSSLSDDLSLSADFGIGPSYEAGEVTLGIALNRYAGVDLVYSYYRLDDGNDAGQQYGPEADLVLRYPNKSILTPYVGAGPGYVKWVRSYKGTAFDDGSGETASAFGGINIRLTRHFGVMVERRQVTWLSPTTPKTYDRETSEPKSTIATRLGFRVSI